MLVDDHPVVRRGLRSVISEHPQLLVVGEAESGAAALAVLAQLSPDIILLDLRLPDGNGADFCRTIKLRAMPPKVVVLTSFCEESNVFAALNAGADGYLLKDSDDTGLINSLLAVADGKRVLAAPIAQMVLGRACEGQTQKPKSPIGELSSRETEIISCISEGLTNKEIAERLRLAEKTVRNNVSTILTKLNVERRAHAVALYVREKGNFS